MNAEVVVGLLEDVVDSGDISVDMGTEAAEVLVTQGGGLSRVTETNLLFVCHRSLMCLPCATLYTLLNLSDS